MTLSTRDLASVVAFVCCLVCCIVLIAGAIAGLIGGLLSTELSGDFASYRVVPCTVVDRKGVPSDAVVGNSFMGVASVRLDNDSVDYAAIRQIVTPKQPRWPTEDVAVAQLNVSIGQRTACGVPDDAEAPTLFASALEWPFPRPAVVQLDRDAAQAQLDGKADAIYAAIATLGVGGSGIVLVIVYFLALHCYDRYGKDHCGCCVDSYEENSLDRRINTSGGKQQQQQQQEETDFTEDGFLTHYTCRYGPGACCTLFLARLCGQAA
jgi:hypothetical protein